MQAKPQPTQALFARERLIRFSDCDPAGIVFYPQYFIMFNGLVEDWFTEGLGVSYPQMVMQRRIGVPTVHLEADFRAVSAMGDQVVLSLDVERLGGRSLTVQVLCTGRDDGVLRMHAQIVMVTTSLESHHAIDIPADVRAAITAAQARKGASA